MGTRSRIGIMHGDKVKSIYCHNDGYLDYNGQFLQQYYDSAMANQMVALGDMSQLQQEIGRPHALHMTYIVPGEFQQRHEFIQHWCTFYGRDGGEKHTEHKVDHTFAEFLERVEGCHAEYYYIMENGVWYCGSMHEGSPFYRRLVLLSEALEYDEIDQ